MIFKVITWFLCFEVFLWYLTVLSQWEWKPGRVSAATLWISCSRRTSLLICSSDGWLSLTSGSFMSLYQSARLIVSIYLLITERHIAIQARWFVLNESRRSELVLSTQSLIIQLFHTDAAEHDWGKAPVTLYNHSTEYRDTFKEQQTHDSWGFNTCINAERINNSCCVIMILSHHLQWSRRYAAEDMCVFLYSCLLSQTSCSSWSNWHSWTGTHLDY